MATLGVIVAGSQQSVDAGAAMYRMGGNAADAAVAAAFATSAGDPSITSLAGGGVFIFRDGASGNLEVGDFFANAPGLGGRRRRGQSGDQDRLPPLDFQAVELDFGLGDTRQLFHIGRGAAAIPGALPGLTTILKRWGRLPLKEVVAPCLKVLRHGCPLTEYQISCLRVLSPILGYSDTGKKVFFDADDKLLAVGAVFRNPPLADTLERLGEEGLGAVYDGEISAAILNEFGEDRGGWITKKDFASWQTEFRPALATKYGGAVVATNPPPALGGKFILFTLELFKEARMGAVPETSSERYRRLAAVFRTISEIRAEFPDIVGRSDAMSLLSKRLEEILGDGLRPRTATEGRSSGNTTHISAIDRDGNVAGVTLSHGEGCGYWIEDTGLHMNNILGEEDLFGGHFHSFTPGERLASMMSPTIIVESSGAVSVLGSGGSNRIRTAMAQAISAIVDDRKDPQSAVCHGRIHFENGVLTAETYAIAGGDKTLQGARRLAKETKTFDAPSLFFGGVHLARRDSSGRLSGAGDPRRGGVVQVVED